MLAPQVLNSNASLNSFKVINTLEFIPGTQVKFVFRLYDDVEELRYTPPSTSVVSVEFNLADSTRLTKIASFNADDRSICTIDLSGDETAQMIGGNALVTVDILGDQSQLYKGLLVSALSRTTIDS